MEKGRLVSLFLSSGVALLATALSYLYYSLELDVAEFGLYSLALAVSVIATIVLDGGLRTTLIKRSGSLSDELAEILTTALFAVSLLMSMAALAGYGIASALLEPTLSSDLAFVLWFVFAYVLSYPLTIVPTVRLERELRYRHVGWIESAGVVVERGLPALLLMQGGGMEAFVLAAYVGRFLRVVSLQIAAGGRGLGLRLSGWRQLRALLAEGIWYQGALDVWALRDNLHVLLIGPFFGKEWLAYYAWVLQVATLSSQLFVQIASRVSVPLLAGKAGIAERWHSSVRYMQVLSVVAVPVLLLVWILLPWVDNFLFEGKWQPALGLVPWLFFRMSVGLATSPLGSLLLVHAGARQYFLANISWTLIEVAACLAAIAVVGEYGLAWSHAFMVLPGVWLILSRLDLERRPVRRLAQIVRRVYFRPAVAMSVLGAVLYNSLAISELAEFSQVVVVAGLWFLVSYGLEWAWYRRSRDAL